MTDGSVALMDETVVGSEPEEGSLSEKILQRIDNEEIKAEVPDAVALDADVAETVEPPVGKTKEELEVATPEVAPTEYSPDAKFTAFGKEHEVPEMFQGLMKDEATEKEVKDILSKAYAIDTYKENINELQGQHTHLQGEYKELEGDVKKTLGYLNNGDLDNFFKELKVPKERIYDWVSQQLHIDSLGPQDRQAYDAQVAQRSQQLELQGTNDVMNQQYNQQAVQLRELQLDMGLQNPEHQAVVSSYDEKMGRVGAFRDLVIEEGQRAFLTTGADISVADAVNGVIGKFGNLFSTPQEAKPVIGQGQAVVGSAGVPQVSPKPVIPNSAGGATSPVKRVPKSLDDLVAMERELTDAGL
jgi:hypothetical protein